MLNVALSVNVYGDVAVEARLLAEGADMELVGLSNTVTNILSGLISSTLRSPINGETKLNRFKDSDSKLVHKNPQSV